jgi:hypothetical protein
LGKPDALCPKSKFLDLTLSYLGKQSNLLNSPLSS